VSAFVNTHVRFAFFGATKPRADPSRPAGGAVGNIRIRFRLALAAAVTILASVLG
jgi:hypothetical protein